MKGTLLRTAAAVSTMAAIAATLLALPLSVAAQDASPEAVDAIPPITWELTSIDDSNAESTTIIDPSRYTIQFLPNGRVAIGADCNRGVSDYTVSGAELSLGEIATTLALCEPLSRSDQYLAALSDVSSFIIDTSQASDQLVLVLESGGSLWFAPSLVGVVWQWQQFQGGDDSVIAPEDPSSYALEFQADGTVTGQVDCNRGFGSYVVDGPSISIVLATTRMACGEESLDGDFGRVVGESTSFVIRDGLFSLALPMDGGIATFAPVYDDPFASADESFGTPEAGA